MATNQNKRPLAQQQLLPVTPPSVPTKAVLNAQIHAGRRRKLRQRLLRDGLQTFNECEVLELALGFGIPRVDTNPAAHDLINKFGSLRAVLDTPPAYLTKAFGIGENAAVFLSFLHQLPAYLTQQNLCDRKIETLDQARTYLQPLLQTCAVEELVVVCLDPASKVRAVKTVTNQELDSVHLNFRELITMITATKAAKVLVAHNHLTEDPQPSLTDLQLTRRLVAVCDPLHVEVLDHLIFAGPVSYSFKEAGTLDAIKADNKHKL